jgi:hypothetical protein
MFWIPFAVVGSELHKSRCGVQYDYGLRQGRSRPIANRPDAFFSSEGKVISVEKSVAEDNEKTLGHGRVSLFFLMSSYVALRTNSTPFPATLVCSQGIAA